jgi:putative membrane protein (TIGR04086 family)
LEKSIDKNTARTAQAKFLLSAVFTWAVSAAALLLAASFAVSRLMVGEAGIGYISSTITFISGAIAGAAAMRKRQKAALYTGLISGTAIIILALTLAFIIDSGGIEAGSVLSLVTFTLAGSLTGSVFCPAGKRKKRNNLSVHR